LTSDGSPRNLLYYGDNLDVLRLHVKDETVNLVYLDPPLRAPLLPDRCMRRREATFPACYSITQQQGLTLLGVRPC
jgi:16S rRNA G966 N2-methylase RsmD